MCVSQENLDKADAEVKPIWEEWVRKAVELIGPRGSRVPYTRDERKALDAEYYPKIQAIRRKYGIPEPD